MELGETLMEGTARELTEETGLQVQVMEMIEVLSASISDVERSKPGSLWKSAGGRDSIS